MPASTLQELYDSEINWSISTFWDDGFDWKLGDDLNGWKAEGTGCAFEDAVIAIAEAAVQHYPNSVFARRGGADDAER